MALSFLTRTRGRGRFDLADWLTWAYLAVAVLLMFGPVLWVALSSFKTEAALQEYPPTLLPLAPVTAAVEGYDEPLPLFTVTAGEHAGKVLAQIRRIGLMSQMVDPADPSQKFQVNINDREPEREFALALENYSSLFERFNFGLYFWNSRLHHRGGDDHHRAVQLDGGLRPVQIQVPRAHAGVRADRGDADDPADRQPRADLPGRVADLGLVNSPWGVIWPAVATPTGVFLLRQYMLTIPDDLLDAARMDHASEWKVYWRIVLPLAAPALAVLVIFSVMWRWNEFLWPLIVLNRSEQFTLQLALNSFQGDLQTSWAPLLAMTVLTLLPITLVFAVLQKYITTGIAPGGGTATGSK